MAPVDVTDRVDSACPSGPGAGEQEVRGGSQVLGDDADTDPPRRPRGAAIATAVEAMAMLQHDDAPLGADAPARGPTKPSLLFVGAARGDLWPAWGKATRRTPRAVAAASLAADEKPRSAGARSGARPNRAICVSSPGT